MKSKNIKGVPDFICDEYADKTKEYCLLIPIINEGDRIKKELLRAKENLISSFVDIIICDGGSNDGSTEKSILETLDVNTLLIKDDIGKQGAQLRIGIYFAMERGYKGVITIDGNNKDSIEDIPYFIKKLKEGYDLIQGSRFIKDGQAINTPLIRYLSVRLMHAPIISLTAKHKFTDTTNAYRGYSMQYLTDKRVCPLRECFMSYELLAYLSTRATQIGYKACEIPVRREYPKKGKTPTKISFFKGNIDLFGVLINNWRGKYNA